ncbi:hypothetical protein BSFA1_74820 (plasmid) [Burkholderia sp. SFA1]|nr:hypothetical protein BSFA1_74820 [Burkholderia sp. SFA1]
MGRQCRTPFADSEGHPTGFSGGDLEGKAKFRAIGSDCRIGVKATRYAYTPADVRRAVADFDADVSYDAYGSLPMSENVRFGDFLRPCALARQAC